MEAVIKQGCCCTSCCQRTSLLLLSSNKRSTYWEKYLHTHKQKNKTHQKCFFFFKISINCYQSLRWKKFAPNSKPHAPTLKATGCGFFTFSFLFLSANGAAYSSVMLCRWLEFLFLLLQNHLWEELKSFHPSQALIMELGGDVKWILKMSTCHLSYISNLEILREIQWGALSAAASFMWGEELWETQQRIW